MVGGIESTRVENSRSVGSHFFIHTLLFKAVFLVTLVAQLNIDITFDGVKQIEAFSFILFSKRYLKLS